jgi:sodium-dependent dicarboxylate transporter 2/3/5
VVLGHFAAQGLLWLTREPLVVPGWGDLFQPGFVTDGTVAVGTALSLFIWPLPGSAGRALVWETVQARLPWGVVLLLGGGFALGDAFESSGLSAWISAEVIPDASNVSVWALLLLLAGTMSVLTEFTSNVATIQIALPLLAALAVELALPPALLMVPAVCATSFAFMLPVATPPNAIAFAGGSELGLRVSDMLLPGLAANLLALLCTVLFSLVWAPIVFGYELP